MNNHSILNERWQPLGLDAWRRDGGYMASLEEIESQLDRFDEIGKSHCKNMGAVALRANLAHQAERNGRKPTLIPEDSPSYEGALTGQIMPSDMVRLLNEYPDLQSAELARLTHVGTWDTNDSIDDPVRTALLNEDLETEPTGDSSYYTINMLSRENPNEVGIARKRVVYQHFGGRVLTVITNNLLIDLSDRGSLDRQFRLDLRAYVKDPNEFKYSDHHGFLRDNLETKLRNPDVSTKSNGLIPLSTIYYGTLTSARKNADVREQNTID